jgi:hypothetical protein
MLHFQEVQEIFGLEAPALEQLGLEFSEYDPVGPVAFPQISGTALFKGQAPKLRTFTLSGDDVFIPWSSTPRGQLTRIQITRFKGMSTTDVSLSEDLNQLIDLLISSPAFEVLVLEFCLPAMLSQVSHGELEPIHLPCLSRLQLGGSTTCVTNFLKRLTLPSSAIPNFFLSDGIPEISSLKLPRRKFVVSGLGNCLESAAEVLVLEICLSTMFS